MPAPPSLSEAKEAFAEWFLDDVLLCLPILGHALFETSEAVTAGSPTSDRGDVALYLRAKGIEATCADTAAGFVVRASSKAVSDDKMAPLAPCQHARDARRTCSPKGSCHGR